MIIKKITSALTAIGLLLSTPVFTSATAYTAPPTDNPTIIESNYEIFNKCGDIMLNFEKNMTAHVKVYMSSPENPECYYYDEKISSTGSNPTLYLLPLDAVDDAVYTLTIFVPESPDSEKGQTFTYKDIIIENTAYSDSARYNSFYFHLNYTTESDLKEPKSNLINTHIGNSTTCRKEYLVEFYGTPNALGDVNCDLEINALDASLILAHYASINIGGGGTFTGNINLYADINSDSEINALDASLVLSYYSYTSIGGKESLKDFLSKKD